MSNRHPNPSSVGAEDALKRLDAEAREVERLKHLAVDLDAMHDEARVGEMMSRRQIRDAGFRPEKRERRMAVPRSRKRRRRRR